ncbi:MAG: hypothetical protein ABIN95_04675 [Mucilaginibacter sp.]
MSFTISCNTKQGNAVKDTTVHYAELDMFKLRGLYPIKKKKSYPYITVTGSDSTKREINYYFSKGDTLTYRYVFNKHEHCWVSRYNINVDTGFVLVIRKVFRDKIVSLDYAEQDSNQYYLGSFDLFSNNKKVRYHLSKREKVKMGLFDSSYPKKNMDRVSSEATSLHNNEVWEITNAWGDEDFRYKDTMYFDIGKHSLNWYYTYQNFIMPIKSK